jgi:hypothetical protein
LIWGHAHLTPAAGTYKEIRKKELIINLLVELNYRGVSNFLADYTI